MSKGSVTKTITHEENFRTRADKEAFEAEKDLLERKKQALTELLQRECIGKYKIEIVFSSKRSTVNPTAGMLSIWESASQLHGGGDGKVYICPGKMLKVNTCEALIPFGNTNFGHNLCPACGQVWKNEQVLGEIMGVWTMQTWAAKVDYYFKHLGHSADIYVKQPKVDLRAMAAMEQSKQLQGDKLRVSRTGLVRYIYPLARILKDTQNGTDAYSRFYAFLKS